MVNIAPQKEVKVREGEHVKFTCSATGVGADGFIYQWFLNDLPVANQHTSTLTIAAMSENNAGDYRCFVRNQYNATSQSEVVTLVLCMHIIAYI